MKYMVDNRCVTYYNTNKEYTAELKGEAYQWKSTEEITDELNAIVQANKDKLEEKQRNKRGWIKIYNADGNIKLTVDVDNKLIRFIDFKYKGNKNFLKD